MLWIKYILPGPGGGFEPSNGEAALSLSGESIGAGAESIGGLPLTSSFTPVS